MNHITDSEYLSRPLIKDVTYLIDNDCVNIFSPNTCFVRQNLLSRIDVFGLLRMYQEIIQNAKAQGVSISYSMHIKKKLINQRSEYEKCHKEAFSLFRRMVEQAKVVRDRGIHIGCSDDRELDELHEMSNQYSRYFWRDSVLSKMNEYSRRLNDLQTSLAQQNPGHGKLIKISA